MRQLVKGGGAALYILQLRINLQLSPKLKKTCYSLCREDEVRTPVCSLMYRFPLGEHTHTINPAQAMPLGRGEFLVAVKAGPSFHRAL